MISKAPIDRGPVNASPLQLFDRQVDFAAAPDVLPPDRFNAGVMLVTPSEAVLEDMLSKVAKLPTYDGGDTGDKSAQETDGLRKHGKVTSRGWSERNKGEKCKRGANDADTQRVVRERDSYSLGNRRRDASSCVCSRANCIFLR